MTIETPPTIAAPGALVTVDPAFMDRLVALRQTIAPTLNDAELELFGLIAQRKGLDPFSGQIVAVKRNTNRGARVTYQTGIDGYRSIAERTGEYLGSDEPEFGPACTCGHPATYHPEWSRVVVHRLHPSGNVIHQPGKAKWHEFVPSDDFMWTSKPEVMIGKCAEAQGLRKAFPWVLGDLYIPEELARGEEPQVAPTVSAREAVAAQAAALRGETAGGAPDDGGGDANGSEPTSSDDPATPMPSGAPSAAESISADVFKTRLRAAGLPVSLAGDVSAELFPGRTAASLSDEEWGALWAAVAARAT